MSAVRFQRLDESLNVNDLIAFQISVTTWCPMSHPYALDLGQNCCKTGRKLDLVNPPDCDAGAIHFATSLDCCQDCDFVPCTGLVCTDGEIGKSNFLPIFFYPQPYLAVSVLQVSQKHLILCRSYTSKVFTKLDHGYLKPEASLSLLYLLLIPQLDSCVYSEAHTTVLGVPQMVFHSTINQPEH